MIFVIFVKQQISLCRVYAISDKHNSRLEKACSVLWCTDREEVSVEVELVGTVFARLTAYSVLVEWTDLSGDLHCVVH